MRRVGIRIRMGLASFGIWDGEAWTDHVYVQFGEAVPRAALSSECSMALWVRRALLVHPILTICAAIGSLYAFDDFSFDQLNRNDFSGNRYPFSLPRVLGFQIAGWVSLVVFVALVIWTYRAAITARALGIPAPRQPSLVVVGWVVPIISFWWPYQSVHAMTPYDREITPLVQMWWGCYLGQMAMGVLIYVILAATSLGTALILGLVPLGALAVASAALGRRLVARILEIHERELAGRRLDVEPISR